MPELLTAQLVGDELKRLLAAFPRNLGSQNPAMMADVYKNGLRGIDGEALRAAVDMCIQNDTYFPKVSRLREAAGEWIRRNRAHFAPKIPTTWNICPVCGARASSPDITRPQKHGDGPGAYYITAKEYRMPQGEAVIAAGRHIPAGKLLDALARGMVLVMETVPNPRTIIEHDPRLHHVRPDDAEYEAAS